MNRIREIRKRRGLTGKELADKVGTDQVNISRLENGKRKLTEEWMRRIAKALEVTPADLITAPLLQDFQDDAAEYESEAEAHLLRAMKQRNLVPWIIRSNCLENLGIMEGQVRTFDLSQEAVENVATGSVVLARLYERGNRNEVRTVIRQFVAPGLLVTNQKVTNLAVTLDHPNVEGIILGVMVEDHEH